MYVIARSEATKQSRRATGFRSRFAASRIERNILINSKVLRRRTTRNDNNSGGIVARTAKKTRSLGDGIFKGVLLVLSLCIPLFMGLLLWEIGHGAMPALKTFGFSFLTSSEWDPVAEKFGALPFLFGTLFTSLIALLLAAPLGVGSAIFLAEYAPRWLKSPLSFLIELLAAIPSVIYGLWGILTFVPRVRMYLEPGLAKYFGFLPFFRGPMYGVGFLAAGLILAVMAVPFIASVSQEVLLAVPRSQREAALALGATKWEVVRIAVLRYARSGVIGAIMLGLGRAIGETMAVTMVIGNTAVITASLFSPGYTMASVLANEFAEASGTMHTSALMAVGLVLLGTTVALNSAARLLVNTIAKGPQGVQRF